MTQVLGAEHVCLVERMLNTMINIIISKLITVYQRIWIDRSGLGEL